MLVVLLTRLVLADVVMIESGGEPACHPVARSSDDTECERCTVYRGSRMQCEQLEVQGYSKVCEVTGSKVSTEVLCRKISKPEPATDASTAGADPTPPPSEGGWGCMQLTPAASLPFLVMAVLPLRRRRRDQAA